MIFRKSSKRGMMTYNVLYCVNKKVSFLHLPLHMSRISVTLLCCLLGLSLLRYDNNNIDITRKQNLSYHGNSNTIFANAAEQTQQKEEDNDNRIIRKTMNGNEEPRSSRRSSRKTIPFLSDDVIEWMKRTDIRGGARYYNSDSSSTSNYYSRQQNPNHLDYNTLRERKIKQQNKSKSSSNNNPNQKGSKRRKQSSSSSSSNLNPSISTLPTKLTNASPPPKPVTVLIPGYGKAEGRREGGVDIWKGIPYAAPPVGQLRFAPPEAASPWAPSRLDASKFGPDCFQLADPLMNPGADAKRMSEDCLYLNIFTPAGQSSQGGVGGLFGSVGGVGSGGGKLLPVMVWMHGGAFQQGGARRLEYDGRRLAERGIIVVTLNYRLGALGFLVSSSDGLFGNWGLMDQRAALDWVKGNIKAFGGDPNNITLFGESAGAVMIGLHLMMDGAGTLFHKAVMQSNPMGYTFRSVVIADFIGDALKRAVDCRDLACLRAERVEEIMRAQTSLMGVPRSVGDFFTWSPTLTKETKLKFSLGGDGTFISKAEENRLPRLEKDDFSTSYVTEWRLGGDELTSDSTRWSSVNVTQPLSMLNKIPDNIPIMIGTNKHEGEMFVHTAFPAPMPKAVYWMFVGALFRDSASRVLKHYRGLVDEVEREADELARKQLYEEENKQEYLENRQQLDSEYEMLVAMNQTRRREKAEVVGSEGIRTLVNTWSTGGYTGGFINRDSNSTTTSSSNPFLHAKDDVQTLDHESSSNLSWGDRLKQMAKNLENKRLERIKAKALKEAARVVVDYRPVMSAIISDYLFRCPSWHFAQQLTEIRERRGQHENNVFVYRFSQPTHIPGYKECWGKSCHTAELPYVFQAMDVIRSNYSTLSTFAQNEAPSAPEYPYTQIMAAYRGAFEAIDNIEHSEDDDVTEKQKENPINTSRNHTKAFQNILRHFFGDYFREDADEELASDMAERWASFARESNPNYEGSKAEWLPWRNRAENSTLNEYFTSEMFNNYNWEGDNEDLNWQPSEEEYDYWSEYDETDEESVNDSVGRSSDMMSTDMIYRSRALQALELDVVEDSVFKTELRRIQYRNPTDDDEMHFLRGRMLLPKRLRWYADEKRPMQAISKSEAREAIRLAHNLGLIGIGLNSGFGSKTPPLDSMPFYPEFLELSWPPEGRLIERDCTCDFWDRIRYRY